MKLQSLAIVLASCLSSATAQGLTGLPTCAQDCATGSIPKECSLIDIECICGSESFIADMACCVGKTCEKADQDAALDFANGLCEGAGISNLPQTATCTGDSNSTATSTGTTTATESTSTGSETTATTTTKPEETSSTTTESSTDTATESSNETSSETSTSAASETPAEPQESDGAAQLRGKGLSLVAGIAAGAAFLM
ncbi:hypothetical protein BJY01DRAFT_242168 [Aspergillus pseudoustus]|uniref:CFEM domain-containing protein n=1 Tax=Aspergillus pseudoustus TaxID=1810923 RepID=A0ABR4L080_9EURO